MSTKLKGNNTEPVTDETVITFGIHTGKKIANVPARYLIFIYEQGKCPENIRDYIKDNWDVLKKQEKEEYDTGKPRRDK